MARSVPPGSALRVLAAGDTHVGGRSFNEDAVLLRPDLDLYLAADGAGGHNAGNVASALATSAIAHFFEETSKAATDAPEFDVLGLPTAARRLATAIQRANREVIAQQKTSERHRGMGTTIVAAMPRLESRVVHLAYVGDSRCYRLRDGHLEQLTNDHTLINDVLELSPEIDDSLAAELPRNVTTRALGMSGHVRVAIRTHELAPGDLYLLCTDGLTRVLEDGEIWEELQEAGSSEKLVKRLIDRAMAAEPQDNLAVVVIQCEPAKEKPLSAADKRPPLRRARPKPRASSTGEGDDESEAQAPDIEIIMVEAEPPQVPLPSPDLQVVPLQAENLSDTMLRALHGVVVPMVPKVRPPLATLPHTDVIRCGKCGQLIEASTEWCPHCGGAIKK